MGSTSSTKNPQHGIETEDREWKSDAQTGTMTRKTNSDRGHAQQHQTGDELTAKNRFAGLLPPNRTWTESIWHGQRKSAQEDDDRSQKKTNGQNRGRRPGREGRAHRAKSQRRQRKPSLAAATETQAEKTKMVSDLSEKQGKRAAENVAAQNVMKISNFFH
jgi:hypothetical protein